MIDLYAWGTTNGRRALIMAEESGLPFKLHQIDIRNGAQNTEAYKNSIPTGTFERWSISGPRRKAGDTF